MTGNKIREKRTALGLSQLQLAFLSRVPNSVISDFELGKRMPWPKARRALADALGEAESILFPTDGNERANDIFAGGQKYVGKGEEV